MTKIAASLSCFVLLILMAAFTAAGQSTFTNSTPITINDDANASPYPSTITVSGMGTSIANTNTAVRVTLNGFSHTFPDDVGIALVGPTGAAFLLQDGAGANPDMSNVTYTISDSGATQLPDATAWGPGTYRPAAYYASNFAAIFPAPGPGTTYNAPPTLGTSTLQATFAGTNPNGTWRLYVIDSLGGDVGSISGGWSLTITSIPSAADATVSGVVLTPDGRGLTGATVILADKQGNTRSTVSGRRGYFQFTEVETGETYVLSVKSRIYKYPPTIVDVHDSVGNIVLQPEN